MSETGPCPYCGSAVGNATEAGTARSSAGGGETDGLELGLEPLYREVRRIREIAEARAAGDDGRRIADLSRQVRELRATVARLRGSGAPGLVATGAGPSRPG